MANWTSSDGFVQFFHLNSLFSDLSLKSILIANTQFLDIIILALENQLTSNFPIMP